jgi:hypothetical protein
VETNDGGDMAPGLSAIQYASCEPGYPVYAMTVWRNAHFNWRPQDAVEASTWGSITSLYFKQWQSCGANERAYTIIQ